jgi:nucleotide-binding universal stress UspA family protein
MEADALGRRAMAYRDILVHLDSTRSCAGRVEAAIGLARRYEAHLTGVYPTGEPSLPGYMAGAMPIELLQMQERRAKEAADKAAASFRQACERAGIQHECRIAPCRDFDVADVLALHLRYSDLAVLGQHDPDDPLSPERGMMENVILGSGRPAVMVPYIGAKQPLGDKIMIAWDAKREAARAVADAMPFLTAASLVTVMVVNPGRGGAHGQEPGADIALHLARHGVKAEVQHSQVEDISIGDALLSRLADESIDLLVMGAYGHTRMRELVLGGVTRTILEHMTVPVFMSH